MTSKCLFRWTESPTKPATALYLNKDNSLSVHVMIANKTTTIAHEKIGGLPKISGESLPDFSKYRPCFDSYTSPSSVSFFKALTIFANTINGKLITVGMDALTDTVEQLKLAIQDKDGTPASQMRLVYAGKQLDNDRSLCDYKIENESIVNVTLRLLGGDMAGVDFNSLEKEKLVDYTKGVPQWCYVSAGLNLRGRCEKIGCEAYDQTVWIPKGLGKFAIGKLAYTSKCPMCKEIAKDVRSLGFSDCKYKFKGIQIQPTVKAVKEPKEGFSQTPTEKFVSFEEGPSVKWSYLNITTVKKDS